MTFVLPPRVPCWVCGKTAYWSPQFGWLCESDQAKARAAIRAQGFDTTAQPLMPPRQFQPTPVFAVFKAGVYRHECAGIFTDVDVAKSLADKLVAAGDGYHTFEVVPFDLDVPCEVRGGDDVREPAIVHVAGDGMRR